MHPITAIKQLVGSNFFLFKEKMLISFFFTETSAIKNAIREEQVLRSYPELENLHEEKDDSATDTEIENKESWMSFFKKKCTPM